MPLDRITAKIYYLTMSSNTKLVIATKNKGKVREIRHSLKGLPINVLSLTDMPHIPSVSETAKTLEGNAIKKAVSIAKKLKTLVLADDSGLEVMALKGKPGVRSARFAGPDPTTIKLCNKILKVMKGKKDRRARFVCVIAVATPSKYWTIKGICNGRIIDEMLGNKGFGYDPVFVPNGHKKTFAQMPLGLKNRISHRGRALQKAKKLLKSIV